MLGIHRLLMVGILCVGIAAATTAQAGNQLFTAEWYTKSFGNELTGGTGPSSVYSAWGIPQGIQCNRIWPRCPFQSTPTDGKGNFNPLGGLVVSMTSVPAYCAPWYNFNGGTTGNGALTGTVRPGKGGTLMTGMKDLPVPPLYRNYAFFTATTPNAMPNTTYCNATSTSLGGFPGKTGGKGGGPGKVMLGNPVAGAWTATTSTVSGNFNFAAVPANHANGIRVGQGTRTTMNGKYYTGSARSGLRADFQNLYPYIYSYTYATLRNDAGTFGKNKGPGNFSATYAKGAATIVMKERAGGAKFGGTMRMLGALTTKVCYFRQKACSLGGNNWRYEAVGASANYTTTPNSGTGTMIASGYEATYLAVYYHTGLGQASSIQVEGERFPWTTGSVTVKATGRGPHKTVHYTHGYDNRTASGKGTIQLVTPVLTRWLQPCCKFETGGVGVLRIQFVPEPQTWAVLVAGISLLGVGSRMRKR